MELFNERNGTLVCIHSIAGGLQNFTLIWVKLPLLDSTFCEK